jgi:hypothetical protein
MNGAGGKLERYILDDASTFCPILDDASTFVGQNDLVEMMLSLTKLLSNYFCSYEHDKE